MPDGSRAYDPDDNSLYGCDQFPPKGTNYTQYCSREMQALQAQALGTLTRKRRKKAYSAIQKLLGPRPPGRSSCGICGLLQPISPAFKNFAPNPMNEAWNAYQWEL